jgi:hypothetical protein
VFAVDKGWFLFRFCWAVEVLEVLDAQQQRVNALMDGKDEAKSDWFVMKKLRLLNC